MQSAITKGMILDVSSNADVYERGEKYYRDGKLLSLKSSEESTGHSVVKATVEGNYKNYEVTLRLEPAGSLHNYTCSCESHSIWRGACKHVVAALFAHAEGHTSVLAPEKMQQQARSLTDALEKLIFNNIDESMPMLHAVSAPRVKLAPVLHCEKQSVVYLTFTVGFNRMYIIKNIPAFVSNVRRGETANYGNGLKFSHHYSMFDEESRPLLDFILREESLYAEIEKRISKQFVYMNRSKNDTRSLTVTERNIDDFFELFKGTDIDAETEFGSRLSLTDSLPPFRMQVIHEKNGTRLKSESFRSRALLGKTANYIISDGSFYRMPKYEGQILFYILKAMAAAPRPEILFGGHEQTRFLSIILPKLTAMGLISSVEGETPARHTTELLVKYYFDSDGHDVTAQIDFCYDDITINSLHESEHDILRDAAGEYTARQKLAAMGFSEEAENHLFRLNGNENIYAFLHAIDGYPPGIDLLKENAEVYITDGLKNKTLRINAPKFGLHLQGNLLHLSLEDSGYSVGELLEALESYKARKKFYRLKDGRFLPLEHEGVTAAAELLSSLDVSRREIKGEVLALPAYRALYLEELTKRHVDSGPHSINKNEQFQRLIEHFKNHHELGYTVPESLSRILREYQKAGFFWLKTLAHYGFGGILADDMGLGKTLQIISLLLSEQKKGVYSLVISPTSLLYNWENEIKRFAPQLKSRVINGLPEKRKELLQHIDADILITTYDMLKRDIAHYEGLEFAYIIADEAQNIKNPSTQNAKAIKELKGRVRFALTGTPIENTLTELWSIFDFIMPGYLHVAHKFHRLYEHPIVRNDDREQAAKLRQQISPFVLRRIKENVLTELPDKTETVLPAELTQEQHKIYYAHLLQAKGELEDITAKNSFADSRMRILAQLTRLRQVCCHPSLFLNDYSGGSGKLELTLETIQMAVESGHRILLFSQFTAMLDLLRKALEETPFSYFYLDGATKSQERMEMTSRFNAGEKDMFLISLKAGGTGLNLTGADVVIHYDPWWNPSVMDQASDRAHRFGQKKAVQVFNIVAKDSIEEKIMELQQKKRDLIDSVITEGGSLINTLTEAEVRELFMV